jgi:hypothetical protein
VRPISFFCCGFNRGSGAGDSPAATHFLLLRQKKVSKEKATLLSASLRFAPGNLRCSVQAGSRSTRLRLRQSRSLIRLNLRSSAHTEGVGARNTKQPNTKPEYLKPRGHAMACPCLSWSSLSWGSVFDIRTAPFWLGRAAQMEAGSGPQLFERSEFCGPPPESSSTGCLKRSARTQTAGRLFFGDVLLAKQKKVTCRRATPGQQLSATFTSPEALPC